MYTYNTLIKKKMKKKYSKSGGRGGREPYGRRKHPNMSTRYRGNPHIETLKQAVNIHKGN